jgi:uncharacterized repeat protein (TIGR03837 family)
VSTSSFIERVPDKTQAPVSWMIFCSVIDNYGDMGVCWRLARQLVGEHGFAVSLWIDDWSALCRFLGLEIAPEDTLLSVEGVALRHWSSRWPDTASAEALIENVRVVVEAFACELPQALIVAMAQCPSPPCWINLEYLSAEAWVQECHGLHSVPALYAGKRALTKYFFFPGFVPGTGGLLRERELLAQHRQWQENVQQERRDLLRAYGLDTELPAAADSVMVSLFTYESAALSSWLRAAAEDAVATLCLVPNGLVVSGIADFFGLDALPLPGTVLSRGNLTVVLIPFLSQADYDRLLSGCDFNFVRGEDSFVRAQWAARPLLWHIYPQDQDAHLTKLDAFLDLYCQDRSLRGSLGQLARFWRCWNQGEDCAELWHHLRPQLPGLRTHARGWQQHLAAMPGLAASLVQFYRDRP